MERFARFCELGVRAVRVSFLAAGLYIASPSGQLF